MGSLYNQAANAAGYIDSVEYFNGATFALGAAYEGQPFTLGSYFHFERPEHDNLNQGNIILGEGSYTAMHEYGQYLQSQECGPLYLLKYGLP